MRRTRIREVPGLKTSIQVLVACDGGHGQDCPYRLLPMELVEVGVCVIVIDCFVLSRSAYCTAG